MLRFIDAIQRRVRLIRYYSALPPRTRLRRAGDRLALAALILAWPATFVLDHSIVGATVPRVITGSVHREPDGRLWGWVNDDSDATMVTGEAAMTASFSVVVTSERHGFPFASSVIETRPRMDMERYTPRRSSHLAVLLAVDDPMRPVIDSALRDGGEASLAEGLFGGSAGGRVVHIRPWIANGVLLSLGGATAIWMIVALLSAAVSLVGHRRAVGSAERASAGACRVCGYDLRGNPFGGLCPECGETW